MCVCVCVCGGGALAVCSALAVVNSPQRCVQHRCVERLTFAMDIILL